MSESVDHEIADREKERGQDPNERPDHTVTKKECPEGFSERKPPVRLFRNRIDARPHGAGHMRRQGPNLVTHHA
jgi:hypothetical protein